VCIVHIALNMADADSSVSSKSGLKWRVTEIARCPICLDDIKNPKSLPCLHTFCLKCLQESWKDKNPKDRVSCMVCRKVLVIPKRGLDALPHNFFVENLIDARDTSEEQTNDVLCEACENDRDETDGNVPPATMYCVDCNQKLCKRCSRPHRAMAGGPHQVKELGEELTAELLQQRGTYCDKHAGKRLELYCFDCKVNVCIICFAVEHNQHKCREIKKAAEDFSMSSEADNERISLRKAELCDAAAEMDVLDNQLTSAVEDSGTLVRERGEMLKRAIDRQVGNLLGEFYTFKKSTQKELASRKDRLQLGITAMDSFTEYSQELMSKGTPHDITRSASDLHARAEEMLQTYAAPDGSAPAIKFDPMNFSELTGSRGTENSIGHLLTSYTAGK